jgi:hypothetical protein
MWVGGLVVIILIFHAISGSLLWREARAWLWISVLSGNIGTLIPFAAFAGGVVACRSLSAGGIAARAVVLSAISFALMGYVSPQAEYRDALVSGRDVTAFYPFGPATPGTMAAQREAVRANPPEAYSFNTEHPLRIPPNWLTYLIHTVWSFPLFAILAAFLGQLVGRLTTGLSPPARRNARWALGLASALAFFLPLNAAGDWVRLDPSNSGIAAAWLPLLVPLAEMALLVVLVRRREARLLPRGSATIP